MSYRFRVPPGHMQCSLNIVFCCTFCPSTIVAILKNIATTKDLILTNLNDVLQGVNWCATCLLHLLNMWYMYRATCVLHTQTPHMCYMCTCVGLTHVLYVCTPLSIMWHFQLEIYTYADPPVFIKPFWILDVQISYSSILILLIPVNHACILYIYIYYVWSFFLLCSWCHGHEFDSHVAEIFFRHIYSPCCNVSYYNYNSIRPYYIVIH